MRQWTVPQERRSRAEIFGTAVGDGRIAATFADGDSDYLAAFAVEDGSELWRYRISERPAGGEAPEGYGWPIWARRTEEMLTALFPLR